MNIDKVKCIIEAILFVSEEPISLDKIKNLFEESIEKKQIKLIIEDLIKEYQQRDTALQIKYIANGYQLCTKSDYAHWINKLYNNKKIRKISRPSLETLAIVAYKQPIIKAEIESIRGITDSSGQLRVLLEKKMIKILGRKDVPGRPLMYGTTSEFLQYFGLPDLSALPQINEFKNFEWNGEHNGH